MPHYGCAILIAWLVGEGSFLQVRMPVKRACSNRIRQEEFKVNKHSIIATPHIPETAAVALAYAALKTAINEVQSASYLVKEANGNLCEAADFIPAPPGDDIRWKNQGEYYRQLKTIEERKLERQQRRITLYGCKLRWLGTIEALSKARLDLVNAVNALRTAIDGNTDAKLKLQLEAARCNVIFAEAVLLSSAKLHREMRKASDYGMHPEEHYAGAAGRINLTESLAGEYDRNRREWVVMSSGHGSSFRFDGGDGSQVPEGPYQTFDEARADGIAWEMMSDTIGGRAQLYNVRTKETVGTF